MSQYRLIFTNIGLSKKQNAELNNDYIEITEFAVGSGNIVNLLPTMTGLIHEEYRADINNVDTKNGTTIFDLIVPSSVGGFYIKEVALFDVDGDCICIGNVPITYKVNQDEGASKAIHLKVSTTSTNTENIVFNTDDSLVYATVSYVNNSVNTLRNEMLEELPKKVNILDIKNNLTSNDTNKPLSAAQGKALNSYIEEINLFLESLGISDIKDLQTALNSKLETNSNAVSATKIKMDTAGTSCLTLFENTPANYATIKEINNTDDAPNLGYWFIYSIRHSDSSNLWGTQIAYGWGQNANTIYQRNVEAGTWTPWRALTHVTGMIIMWNGSTSNIPIGWALCNGQNGTPNLTDRFVVGAGATYNPGVTGGSKDAIVPSHYHHGWTAVAGWHAHNAIINGGSSSHTVTNVGDQPMYVSAGVTDGAGNHQHEFNTDYSGASGANKNLPPYYALCYIMKL